MYIFEKLSRKVRHSGLLEDQEWILDNIRPIYNHILSEIYNNTLERVINDDIKIKIGSNLRNVISEEYEEDVWNSIMSEVDYGDRVGDIGAHVGIYSVALGNHVGADGRVFAFEPDPKNFEYLKRQIKLNEVENRVVLNEVAVGGRNESVFFESDSSLESRVSSGEFSNGVEVRCVTLDRVFEDSELDILKIDVEGYEVEVLKGGRELLSDESRCPRAIYIEVHPGLWSDKEGGVLLNLLTACDYEVLYLDGTPVESINNYGEVVARKRNG